MTLQDEELDALWDHLWGLEDRINHGETLELSGRMRSLLLSAAPTVALSSADAEAALASVASATALLLEIRKRIREGSHRVNDALIRMYALQDAGDLKGARQQMQDVLAVEVVPLYREIAEGEIAKLDDLSS
ncbi:DUSAM domain-containing protein [Stigmatella sp. ncwal1]|uniref:DUSAM domain-containing protein n=1 Tax=Stigmatella ashevillensis TaxID=2995309 RepID=A0ABT5DK65_9BACT|nr:DUSAM domain-containing protein [Stigmatella ashevillena]MDC0712742.1 DUSAM domain-containing protein [Stigmatella ashevillena]